RTRIEMKPRLSADPGFGIGPDQDGQAEGLAKRNYFQRFREARPPKLDADGPYSLDRDEIGHLGHRLAGLVAQQRDRQRPRHRSRTPRIEEVAGLLDQRHVVFAKFSEDRPRLRLGVHTIGIHVDQKIVADGEPDLAHHSNVFLTSLPNLELEALVAVLESLLL